MGKVKIKRKSTLIDMTAMSDVTVLLLTFFMLTSSFLQKKPTTVQTPSSVSEEKVPVKNLVSILVSSADKTGKLQDPAAVEGKIFIGFAGDSIFHSDSLRYDVLDYAVGLYNEQLPKLQAKGIKKTEQPIRLTQAQRDAFAKTSMMGTSFKNLTKVLDMDAAQRDKLMSDLTNPMIGIPISDRYDEEYLNDFQIWMKALRLAAQEAKTGYLDKNHIPNDMDHKDQIAELQILANALSKGQGISIEADKDTPFSVIKVVFENLRFMELNKFTLMTALKQKDK